MSQLNKAALQGENQTNFPNNTTGYITPSLLRSFNTDMIDSVALQTQMDAVSQSVNNLITGSRTYATTGSNTFNGNQLINGNVTVNVSSSFNISNIVTLRNAAGNNITLLDTNDGLQIRNFNEGELQIDQNANADLTLTSHLQDIHLYTPSGNIFFNDVDFEQYSASVDTRLNNAQGTQGITGTQGRTGTQGTNGVVGSQGAIGSQGVGGAQGSIGLQGITGAQGLLGNQGITGAKGDTGTTGAQGQTGTQGAVGSQGTTGQSIQGLQGTQGTSIQGADGAQGLRGLQGTQGAQGTIGQTGNVGSQGSTGVTGGQGIQGSQGSTGTGTQGTTGGQGAQGIQGSQGAIPNTGSFATTGSNTFTGSQIINAGAQAEPGLTISGSLNTLGNLNIYGVTNFISGSTQFRGTAFTIEDNSSVVKFGVYNSVGLVRSLYPLEVQAPFTASLTQGYVWVGDSNNITKLVATSSFGSSINTGSFATTGSNSFNGNQTITGSLNVSGASSFSSVVNLSGSLNAYGDVRVTSKLETDVTAFIKSNNITGSWGQTNDVNGNALRLNGVLYANGNIKVASTFQLQLPSGSNQQTGIFVLDGGNPGTATISNSLVTANSLIFLTKQTNTNSGNGTVSVTSKGSGTFSVTSDHNGDTDTVAYMIVNPS